MVLSRVLALSLLTISPAALARIKLETHIESTKNSDSKVNVETTTALDANQSTIVYQNEDMIIHAEIINEYENDVEVIIAVSWKNEDGNFNTKATQPFKMPYDQAKPLIISRKIDSVTQKFLLSLDIKATKELDQKS